MQVPFVFGPNDLRLCDVELPRAGPRDVVIRVAAAGICGSDISFVSTGGMMGPTPHPVPLGHELAGTVIEAGAEVSGLGPGARVVLNPLVNMIGNGAPEGGFAEHLLIRDVVSRPESLLILPDSLSFDVGALVEPLAVGAHAVGRVGARAGDKVAIFGAGPIGLASLVMLRLNGVEDIVIFDLSPFRRDRAMQLGAKAAFDPRVRSAAEVLMEVHGTTWALRAETPATTHYIEASGAPVLPEIIANAGVGASICVVSVQKYAVPVDFMLVMAKELTLVGALGYPTEIPEVIDLLCNKPTDLEPMISHRFQGEDFMDAFATAQKPDEAAKVLVRYG